MTLEETCIPDSSSAFMDGYHGVHEDYFTELSKLS
jgi:hypothetical protein